MAWTTTPLATWDKSVALGRLKGPVLDTHSKMRNFMTALAEWDHNNTHVYFPNPMAGAAGVAFCEAKKQTLNGTSVDSNGQIYLPNSMTGEASLTFRVEASGKTPVPENIEWVARRYATHIRDRLGWKAQVWNSEGVECSDGWPPEAAGRRFAMNGTPADESRPLTADEPQAVQQELEQNVHQVLKRWGCAYEAKIEPAVKAYRTGEEPGGYGLWPEHVPLNTCVISGTLPKGVEGAAATDLLQSVGSELAVALGWRAIAIDFNGRELGCYWAERRVAGRLYPGDDDWVPPGIH